MDDEGREDEDTDQYQEEIARDEELTCAICGHPIAQDDAICPNCGVSLAAG